MEIIKKSLKSYQDEYSKFSNISKIHMWIEVVLFIISIYFPAYLGLVVIVAVMIVMYRMRASEAKHFAATFYANDLDLLNDIKRSGKR